MPIQNRKIKLTLIFLLILLSISAFSIIGVTLAVNTKKDTEPPKAAGVLYLNSLPGLSIQGMVTLKKEFADASEIRIQNSEGFSTFMFLNMSQTYNKNVYLDANVSYNFGGNYKDDDTLYNGACDNFQGTFDGQGHTITFSGYAFISEGAQSIFFKTLSGTFKNTKIKGTYCVFDDYGDNTVFGIIASKLSSGAVIKNCIIENVTFESMRGTGRCKVSVCAYDDYYGTIKNIIAQGNYNLRGYDGHGLTYKAAQRWHTSIWMMNRTTNSEGHFYAFSSGDLVDSVDCQGWWNNGMKDCSSYGGVEGTELSDGTTITEGWFCNPNYQPPESNAEKGDCYLRAFINWQQIQVFTRLNSSNSSDAGYFKVDTDEMEYNAYDKEYFPSGVSLASGTSNDSITIFKFTYTAAVYEYYTFAGWTKSGNTYYAVFNHIPVMVEFAKMFDITYQKEIGTLTGTTEYGVKQGTKIETRQEVLPSGGVKIIYTFFDVGIEGNQEDPSKTFSYNISTREFISYFRGYGDVDFLSVQATADDSAIKVQPEVKTIAELVKFKNIEINGVTITPVNPGGLLTSEGIYMPLNGVLTCTTESYSLNDMSCVRIIYDVQGAAENMLKVCYDLGELFNITEYGSGLPYNEWGCVIVAGLEIVPQVEQIAVYMNFNNAMAGTRVLGIAPSQVGPILVDYGSGGLNRPDDNTLVYHYNYNGNELSVTYDIGAVLPYGYNYNETNVLRSADNTMQTITPILEQTFVNVAFKDVVNNKGTDREYTISPTITLKDKQGNVVTSITNNEIIAGTTADNVNYKEIKINVGSGQYLTWLTKNFASEVLTFTARYTVSRTEYYIIEVKYEIENPVDVNDKNIADDYTLVLDSDNDDVDDCGIVKTEVELGSGADTYNVVTLTISPKLDWKVYGGSYGGAQ